MKNFNLISFVVFALITMVSCKKENAVQNNEPSVIQKSIDDYIEHPYTYLQNKYMDSVIAYEMEKRSQEYSPDEFSYEQKTEMILLLDSIIQEETQEETQEDITFYQNIVSELMADINNHPYIQSFVANFALQENYNENDMMIFTGTSDCNDVISKFQILQYYENGIDIIEYYLARNELTGEEEWSLPPVENSMQKAVRYTLQLKWTNIIPYMWNTSNTTIRNGVLAAMQDWKVAADNKISFSEITKKINWNKTCWVMGWKYFIRIGYVNTTAYTGHSTVGMVPWSLMDFTTDAEVRTYRHELGHSLGLHHEHQRPDRDNYIIYNSDNVETGQKSQFSKMTAGSYNYYGSTFDFNSIMLYGSYAFNKNNNATLTKKDSTTWVAPSSISVTDEFVIRQIYY